MPFGVCSMPAASLAAAGVVGWAAIVRVFSAWRRIRENFLLAEPPDGEPLHLDFVDPPTCQSDEVGFTNCSVGESRTWSPEDVWCQLTSYAVESHQFTSTRTDASAARDDDASDEVRRSQHSLQQVLLSPVQEPEEPRR